MLVIAAVLGAWACGVGIAEPGGPNDSGPLQTPPDGGDAGSAGGVDAGSDAGGAVTDGGLADAGAFDAGPTLSFAAILSGADEVPAVATSALGAAAFSLSGRNLAYRLSHIVQSPTAVQIRAGAPGGVRVTLTPVTAEMSGTLALSQQDAADLAAGNLFIDVASAATPNGEIGGAILPGVSFHTALSGAAEVPPVTTTASGWSAFVLSGTALKYHVIHDVTAGTAGHLHQGPPTLAAGPLQVAFNYSTDISGEATLTQAQVDALTDGGLYVQIHSQAHPGGEVRGQVGN